MLTPWCDDSLHTVHISKYDILFPINSYNSKIQKLVFLIYIYLNNMKYLYIIIGHLYLFIIDCLFISFFHFYCSRIFIPVTILHTLEHFSTCTSKVISTTFSRTSSTSPMWQTCIPPQSGSSVSHGCTSCPSHFAFC